jgi:hypothetical protein
MKTFFRLLLTGKDNETYEIGRVLLFIGYVSFLLFSAYDVFLLHHFDPLSFSAGLTGLLFGGSSGIAIKARTEPEKPDDHS